MKKSQPTFKSKVGQVVASRELTDANDPKKRIIVSLGLPREVSSMEWRCDVRIDGLGRKPIVDYALGVDSFQALLLGVETLRSSLKRSPCRLACFGNSIHFTAGGIPRQVPADLGEEFDNRIEQLIEREQRPFREARLKDLGTHFREARKRRAASGERPSSKGRRRSD